jgi:hypothetical protein
MKRCIAVVISLGVASLILAQAPFTIVRPAEGSKVREKVRVTIPKNSIPDGGYIGVFVGGKFLEATVPDEPDPKSKYLEYILDTKGRGLPDGKTTIELVLYVDYSSGPRIMDRSAVDVNITNSTSIKVPDEGFRLRYKFPRGTELTYSVDIRTAVSTQTEVENKSGGKPGELPLEPQHLRVIYGFDNVYSNGDSLLRMQIVPAPGKDSVFLSTINHPEGKKFMDYEMLSLYMRVNALGREIFGSAPAYVPMESTVGEASVTNLMTCYPLPVLPRKAVRPGDRWPSKFQTSALDLNGIYEQNRLTRLGDAAGEFLGIEWEMGYPCAKIRNVIDVGYKTKEGTKLQSSGASFSDSKLTEEEIIWFALDRGVIVKMIQNTTMDLKIVTAAQNSGGSQMRGGGVGAPTSGGLPPPTLNHFPTIMGQGPMSGPPVKNGAGISSGTAGVSTSGMRGGSGLRGGSGVTTQIQYYRTKSQTIMTLEK